MATSNNKTTKRSSAPEQSNRESLRWALGLVLFFVGLFALASSLFYLGDWRADYSALHPTEADLANPYFEQTVDNPCGPMGAWLAEQIMGRSFGLFGVILPLVVILIGLRIIRRRMIFNHALLSSLMVLLLGSITLGFIFGTKWGLFGSGMGGAYGVALATLLVSKIGGVGTSILLLGGWILVGVFINRNFIQVVNSTGSAVVDRGEKLVGSLRRKGGEEETGDPAMATEVKPEPIDPTPAPQPEPVVLHSNLSAESAPLQTSTVILPVAPSKEYPAPIAPISCEPTPEPISPLQESPLSEEPLSLEEVRPGTIDQFEAELRLMEQRRVALASEAALEQNNPSDSPFTEVPLSQPESEPELKAVEEEPEKIKRITPVPIYDPVPTHTPQGVDFVDEEGSPFEEVPEPSTDPEGVVVTFEQNEVKTLEESAISQELYDPLKDLIYYKKPSPGLLENYTSNSKVTDEEIFQKKSRIEETLMNFGIPIRSIHATSGPTVTLYEIRQAEGVKISKIQGLENDIAQSIEARGIRIIAPIPGKGTIGIEVPNEHKQIVSMYSSICSPEFQSAKMELPIVIGRTIQNKSLTFDLAKAPHLLVAGATGQGKSVGLNAIITSLLYTKHPAELKFVMIDPKMVEFSTYAGLEKHFLAKMQSEEDAIITDPKKAVYTLHALETEMEERLQLCKKAGARNIVEYNNKFVARRLTPTKGHRFLPYIVVVIDEFADLIMTAKEVERPVMRLAQKARAVGIHLIIATQRPDVRVITGGIKANFPARIAFRVMQMVDSRTIIDQPGAQTLIGRGDMLYTSGGELTRVQCALVETAEVERIVEYIASQQGYPEAYPLPDYTPEGDGGGLAMGSEMGESGRAIKFDPLFAEIARVAVEQGNISVSMIQRNFEVGFNRAGRIMSQLQSAGIVGPQIGAKQRDILFHDLPSLEAKLQDLGLF